MKKIISLFLSLVMTISTFTCVNFYTYAESTSSTKAISTDETSISFSAGYAEYALGATFFVGASYSSTKYSHNLDTVSYEVSGPNNGLTVNGQMSFLGTPEDGIISMMFDAVKQGVYVVTFKSIDGAQDSIEIEITDKSKDVYVAQRLVDRFDIIQNKNMIYHYYFDDGVSLTDVIKSWDMNSNYYDNISHYYELVLTDLLLNQVSSANYQTVLEKRINDISKKCVKYTLKYIKYTDETTLKAAKFSNISSADLEKLNQALEDSTGMKDLWDNSQSFVKGTDTVGDYLDDISKYVAISQVQEEYITVLEHVETLALYEGVGTETDGLAVACSNIAEIFRNKNFAIARVFTNTASTLIYDLIKDVAGEVFKVVFGEAYTTIKIVKDVSIFAVNEMFETDERIKSTCIIKSTNLIESYLKKSLSGFKTLFNQDNNEYAKCYIANHDLIVSCFNYGVTMHEYYNDILYNKSLDGIIGTWLNNREKVIKDDLIEAINTSKSLVQVERDYIITVKNEYDAYHYGNKTQWAITLDINLDFPQTTDVLVYDGEEIDLSSYKPQINGYEFQGWYYDKNCTKAFINNTVANTYMTLYAKWNKVISYVTKLDGSVACTQYHIEYQASPVITKKKAKAKSTQVYFYDIDIPAYIDGYEVTEISDTAFDNCENYNIQSIRIPDTVITISNTAFEKLSTDVVIVADSDSYATTFVKTNGYNASYQSEGVFKYSINDGKVKIIGLVDDCDEADIVIPARIESYPVTEIGISAFKDCSSIKSVTLSSGIEQIDNYAFDNCNLLETINLSDTLVSIGSCAFANCEKLNNLVIPENIKKIGNRAFSNCLNISHIEYNATDASEGINDENGSCSIFENVGSNTDGTQVVIGDNVNIIPDSLFWSHAYGYNSNYWDKAPNIVHVIFGELVETIGDGAFARCENLTKITFKGDNLHTIKEEAFSGCSLTEITLPSSLKKIEKLAFSSNSFTKTEFKGTVDQWTEIEFGDISANPVSTSGNLYLNDTLLTKAYINNATRIGSYVFYNCSCLTNVSIGNNATSIGEKAFYNCINLLDVFIGGNVTGIGDSSFKNCTNLSDIVIGNNVTEIGKSSFEKCKELKNITIPNSVNTISCEAFYDCGLTSITIGNGIVNIGSEAFGEINYHRSSIEKVYIHDLSNWLEIIFADEGSNPLYVGAELYLNDELVNDLIIPDSIERINDYAFYSCNCLRSVTIPDSLKSIGEDAFYGCWYIEKVFINNIKEWCGITFANKYSTPMYHADSLYLHNQLVTDLIVPSDINEIGQYAFYHCSSIKSVELPNTVTNIGDYAFSYCDDLVSVTIPNSVINIGDYAFDVCTALKKLIIGESVTNIGENAFHYCGCLETLLLPSKVSSIGKNAFADCWRIESIIVDEKNPIYDSRNNCNAIIETKTNKLIIGCKNTNIPNDIIIIGECAFEYCDDSNSISLPDSVTIIEDKAFAHCSDITSITLPNSLTTIGDNAFQSCYKVTSLIVPQSVTYIGNEAFAGCSGLETIIVEEGNTVFDSRNNCNAIITKTAYNHTNYHLYEDNTIEANTLVLGCKNTKIPDSVSIIGNHAFTCGETFKEIIIPVSITKIRWSAFDSFDYDHVLDDVYYMGTSEQWNSIDIHYANQCVTEARIHYNTDGSNHYMLKEEYEETCTEDGYRNYNCTCGYEKTEKIPSGHQGEIIKTVEVSDCSEPGYTIYKCTRCGEIYYDDYKYIEHEYVSTTVKPTCTEEGYVEYKCKNCGDSYTSDWTDPLGHIGEEVTTISPTCTNKGYTEYKCSRCGEIYYDDYIDAVGHNFNDGICTRCNMEETDCIESSHPYENGFNNTWTINKPDAKRIAVTFSNDTETESGYDYIYIYDNDDIELGKYSGIELSGKRIVVKGDTVKIRLTSDGSYAEYGFSLSNVKSYYEDCDHNGTETEIRNDIVATCSQMGYSGDAYCIECGELISEGNETPIDSNNHDMQERTVDPTCAEQGYVEYYCWNCDYSYKTNYVPATGNHVLDKGTVTKKATPTSTGTKVYKCTICGQTIKTETIAKTAKYNNTLAVKAKKPTVKYSKLKKKNQTIALKKAMTVSNALGAVTYKLSSAKKGKKNFKKYFKVAKNGKITLKKGLKKGTYKIKIQVTAAGNSEYNASVKTVTVKIKVK